MKRVMRAAALAFSLTLLAQGFALAADPSAPANKKPVEENGLSWYGNLDDGLQDAYAHGRRLFVDFTGVTGANALFNETNVFPKPAVKQLLQYYTLVRLYTDKVPEPFSPSDARKEAEKNLQFEKEKFNTEAMPLYVILAPQLDGTWKEVARNDEAKVLDEAAFGKFLRKGLVSITERIDFKVAVEPGEVQPGKTVWLTITGIPKAGFHTYPLTQNSPDQDPDQLCKLEYQDTPGLKSLPGIQESQPELVNDNGQKLLEHSKEFTWKQEIAVLEGATPGKKTLRFAIRAQVCDKTCVVGTDIFGVDIDVKGAAVAPTPEVKAKLEQAAKQPAGKSSGEAAVSKTADNSLLAFVLQGIFWGAVSLLTPCVFPMIPITVSFFIKQSEKKEHRALTLAMVYSATIVIVLTIAAVALLSLFRYLSTNSLMNFALGALFVFFALSLFGMYEIELPSGLARFTSSREGQGGLVGTMFMALTFTIISFACVAPFLGGFGGTAADSGITFTHRLLGGFAFAATFASPFFVLALFPNLLKKLPKSGSWMNSVKVVMGFLELAAAIKFFRAGELVLVPEGGILSYELCLGLYVALCLLCGLYLLGVYRLPHDTPAEHLGVPRLLWGVLFIGLGLYLTPALFAIESGQVVKQQRPTGAIFAWVDAFLLPGAGKTDLDWKGSLKEGIDDATARRRRIFVDFTGVTCTNCSYNEKNVFTNPKVKELFDKYTLVQLYTDTVPTKFESDNRKQDAAKNLQFQRDKFDTEQLPLYVILEPQADGTCKVVSQYAEGKINNQKEFINFLEKGLNGAASDTQIRADNR